MVYRDVHIETVQCGKRIRLRPMQAHDRYGERVPQLWISGRKRIRELYPVGTVFVADLQLVRPDRAIDNILNQYKSKNHERKL